MAEWAGWYHKGGHVELNFLGWMWNRFVGGDSKRKSVWERSQRKLEGVSHELRCDFRERVDSNCSWCDVKWFYLSVVSCVTIWIWCDVPAWMLLDRCANGLPTVSWNFLLLWREDEALLWLEDQGVLRWYISRRKSVNDVLVWDWLCRILYEMLLCNVLHCRH